MNSLRQKTRPFGDRPSSFRAYVDLGITGPLPTTDRTFEQKNTDKSDEEWLVGSRGKNLSPTVRWYCHDSTGTCDAEQEISLTVKLLPGEVVISSAENVLKFNTFSDLKTGVSGLLFFTTFKLSFVTAHHQPSSIHHQNLLLGENDICLTNIDSIYQVSGGRKKKLTPGTCLQQSLEILEVHCRDLRILTFSFKFSPMGQDKAVVNALLHHTPATKPQLLFLFEYQIPQNSESSPDFIPYTQPPDWRGELDRTGCRGWRVTQANEGFILSINLPECFVVPASLVDADLSTAAPSFDGHRVLTWSWGLATGQALVIMSALTFSIEDTKYQNKFLSSVAEAHPKKLHPVVINISEECPSVTDVQISFLRLKELCMPDCPQTFWEQEATWLSSLESSRWLEFVSCCLKVALSAAVAMKVEKMSVVLQEGTNRDLSCVVSSLSQILLDPFARSQEGFELLIDKEWISMGHPFLHRLGRLRDVQNEESPIFLLFLDCVWQLLQQFPSSFEFSETYLTTLWDSAHISIFPNFMFNNQRDRKDLLRGRLTHSVWNWNLQYSAQDCHLFHNPLYPLSETPSTSLLTKHVLAFRPHSIGPVTRFKPDIPKSPLKRDNGLLDCDPTVMALALWCQCYLRWVPLANIVGGGPPVLYLQNLTAAEEVRFLNNTLKSLCAQNVKLRQHRRAASDEFNLSLKVDSQQIRKNMSLVTSAFPFSPIADSEWRKFNVPTTSRLVVAVGSDIEDDD